MLLATTRLTVDPTWPWDIPYFGLPALGIIAFVLIGLTIWTYLGAGKVTRGQLLTILCLRLGALIVACLLMLRPALAHLDEETIMPTKLLILVDASTSMNIADGFNNTSRWDSASHILSLPSVKEAVKNLAQDNKIEVVYYQTHHQTRGDPGAEGIAPYEPQGGAHGKATDFGSWLHELWQMHGREGNLRGLLIFSDGANNRARFDAVQLAKNRWQGLHTFALGNPSTSTKQSDIALTSISPPAEPLPWKTQFTVSGKIDAWGFKDAAVDVSLWIEDPSNGEMKQAGRKERVLLKKVVGNEISLTRDVPDKAGEYKITLKADPLPGEVTEINNQISSFITVTKEGVSILWVEGRKRLESAFILRYALAKERRIRLYPAEKLADKAGSGSDWFNFDKQHYDVIVIGDISPQRFSSGNKKIFEKISEKVKGGTGLMFFGGHEAFGNSNWGEVPLLKDLLPVPMNVSGQIDGPFRMVPTRAGLSHFLMKLDSDPDKNKGIWEKLFDPLDGMTSTGTPYPTSTILANGVTRDGRSEPMLIATQAGKGRILVFAGDTTWKAWRHSEEAATAYDRFWKQTMFWLAGQENVNGAAWVKLDTRRVTAGVDRRLGFNVGLKGKGGIEIRNAEYKVTVIGPIKGENDVGVRTDVAVRTEDDGQRGYFDRFGAPGEYRIEVEAKGTDPNDTEGGKPKPIKGLASARFLIVTEELENRPPASDHEFMARLARAGGGKFNPADEDKLLEVLGELKAHKLHQPHEDLWPDWRRNPPPPSQPGASASIGEQLATLWSTTALPCMILFVTFLSLEWYLRRRWDLV